MADNTPANSGGTAPLLRETRYSLRELLRDVELERRHSVLGMELVDQGEIGAIFRTRAKRSPAKTRKA